MDIDFTQAACVLIALGALVGALLVGVPCLLVWLLS